MNRNYSNPNNYPHRVKSKRRNNMSGCLSKLLLILLIVLGGLYIWSIYQPSGYATELAPAISSFTGEPDIFVKQTGTEQTTYGRIKQYSANLANGDQVYFDVDKNGDVANFFRAKQPNGEVRITLEQARKKATDFAATHYKNLSWLDSAQISENLTGTNGSSNRFYTFRWINQDPESGAYLPQVLKIDINAQTGQIDNCTMLNEPITVSTMPAIDQKTAIKTALSAIPETPIFEASKVLLIVTTIPIYKPNGEQTLVWCVTVTAKPDKTGYVAGAVIFIDAQTGKILSIDPFV